MSKYLSVFFILFAAQIGINAQKVAESSVPEVVKNNFARVVPNTSVSSWEMDKTNYDAVYIQNGVENSIEFTADGKIVKYEYTIAANELPEKTRIYITTNLAGKKMGEMVRMKTITGEVSYEVEAGDEDYVFDFDGNFLSKDKDTDEK